jgi:RHS repeat-associated protein
VDAVTGETITYQYDLLKRLESASGKNWGETYTYDGFGNMTQMAPTGTAGAPSLSVTVDPTTNRLTPSGAQYYNNGNLLIGFPGIELQYDAANRVSEVMTYDQNSYYGYDSDNRRISSRNGSNNETIYFYGADGTKLATYTYTIVTYNGDPEIQLTQQSENVYFLGKLVSAEGYAVTTDRLGSVRSGGPGGLGYQAEYPYGVEYTTTANDREKYATYTRDSLTGFDYAMNRYYSSQWGRFLSPDPYRGSVKLGSPQAWNRYSYVNGDPINGNDPFGLDGGMASAICGAASGLVFSATLTGPSGACNSAAVTAWSTPVGSYSSSDPLAYGGIDSFSTYTGIGLSQSATVTQIDLAAVGEGDYGQWESGMFWWNTATTECPVVGANSGSSTEATCYDDMVTFSGGSIQKVPGGLSDFLGPVALKAPTLGQPPQPLLGGSLVPTFAPNPTQPTCQAGYHPDPVGGVGNYQCVLNPTRPVLPIRDLLPAPVAREQ